ncbi:MAG: M28 family peptidase [Candidatus Heimdallarchaeota archaeon]|nr:M28 family peptidase [Candidatus Heimdallarchaeota archaeon]
METEVILQVEYPLLFNESNAYDHISSQLDIGFRVPGVPEHDVCADWIRNQIKPSVDSVVTQNFTIQKEGQAAYECQNILGKLNTEEEKIVILGAHWDSRNVSEKDYYDRNLPIPGANDGASGVAVLIELARALSFYTANLTCQVWFLFIDAEDQGYTNGMYGIQDWDYVEGSPIFVENIENFYNPSVEKLECFILLDMVGGTNLTFVKESRSDDNLHDSIFNEGRSLGYNESFPVTPKIMSINDDHIPFTELDIPVVDLIIDFLYGNWTHHHTHSDDISNIDIESLKITGRTIESFIKTYYSNYSNQTWKGSDSGFPIWGYSLIGLVIIVIATVIFLYRKK